MKNADFSAFICHANTYLCNGSLNSESAATKARVFTGCAESLIHSFDLIDTRGNPGGTFFLRAEETAAAT